MQMVLPTADDGSALPPACLAALPSGCSPSTRLGRFAFRPSPALGTCPFELYLIVFRPFLRFVNIISYSSPVFPSTCSFPPSSECSAWALCQAPAAQHSPGMAGLGASRGTPSPDLIVSPWLISLSCQLACMVGSEVGTLEPGILGFSWLLASNPTAECGSTRGKTGSAVACGRVEAEPRCMPQSPSLWPYAPHAQACSAQLQVGGSSAELLAVDMLPSGHSQLVLCWLPCLVPGESGP